MEIFPFIFFPGNTQNIANIFAKHKKEVDIDNSSHIFKWRSAVFYFF